MVKIFPNILTADLKEVKRKLVKLQGLADWIQVDILDGKFVDNKTVSLKQLRSLALIKKFKVLLHLMVDNPIRLVEDARKLGAKAVVGQIEMMPNQEEFVKTVKNKKMKVGLALDYQSSVEKINKKLLARLDIILVMTIVSGWSGQKFLKERLKEVSKLKQLREKNNYKFKITVDGGVNKKTIKDCVRAGGELLFIHSAIWKSKNIKKAIKDLNFMAKTALEDEN